MLQSLIQIFQDASATDEDKKQNRKQKMPACSALFSGIQTQQVLSDFVESEEEM